MPAPMTVSEILDPQCVVVPLQAANKREAIDALVDALGTAGRVTDTAAVKKAVWEREQQRSTGIGEGLAIPHGKSTSARALTMAIGKPKDAIEFGSIDRKPVRMIILLVSPTDRIAEHIQALGKVSRLMTNQQFRTACYEATNPTDLYELFRKAEGGVAPAKV